MQRSVLLQTELPGLRPCLRGKVRDVYDLGEHLLLVATDRISAYDAVLPNGIPDKGRVLTQLSAFWFRRFADVCPNHLVDAEPEAVLAAAEAAVRAASPELSAAEAAEAVAPLAGRAMLVRRARAFPVECVVRGYLEGSAWREYRATGAVCGIPLPAGLRQGSPLPEPLFTPATKAHTGHDENISWEAMCCLVGEAAACRMRALSLAVYERAASEARAAGILIADTKFEFGEIDGDLVMIDECLTPDSSRFWEAACHAPGGPQPSFDKQFVRDYLDSIGWNHEPPAPSLPEDVVRRTSEKYREIFRRLTGRPLD